MRIERKSRAATAATAATAAAAANCNGFEGGIECTLPNLCRSRL